MIPHIEKLRIARGFFCVGLDSKLTIDRGRGGARAPERKGVPNDPYARDARAREVSRVSVNWRLAKWRDQGALLTAWARRGLTQEEIARRMGVSRKTLQRWIREYAWIREPLQRGREIVDAEVENALLKRALGCVVIEKKYGMPSIRPEDLEEGETPAPILLGVTEKEIPPDPRSAMFWLTNRMPEAWKNRIEETEKQTEPIQIVIQAPTEEPGRSNARGAQK